MKIGTLTTCQHCGKTFELTACNQRYCCAFCRKKGHNRSRVAMRARENEQLRAARTVRHVKVSPEEWERIGELQKKHGMTYGQLAARGYI